MLFLRVFGNSLRGSQYLPYKKKNSWCMYRGTGNGLGVPLQLKSIDPIHAWCNQLQHHEILWDSVAPGREQKDLLLLVLDPVAFGLLPNLRCCWMLLQWAGPLARVVQRFELTCSKLCAVFNSFSFWQGILFLFIKTKLKGRNQKEQTQTVKVFWT